MSNDAATEMLLQHVRMKTTSFMTARNPWLEICGATETPTYDGLIRCNVFVPVPVGKECPWKASGSQVLNDASMTKDQHHLVNALQYMFLATELAGNGTPNFVVDQFSNAPLFARVLEAYCRVHMNCKKKATQDDHKLLQQYTQNLTTFNPLMQGMLNATKTRLDRRGRPGQEEEEDEAPPGAPPIGGAGGANGGGAREVGVAANPDSVNAWIQEYLTGFDIVHNEPDRDELPRRMWPLQPLNGEGMTPYGDAAAAAALPDPVRGGEEEEGVCLTLPKVQVTWYIPNPEQKHSIICFSILDPMWTFGYVYRFLLNNPAPAPGKTGAWYRQHDPLSHLRHFGTTHVANCFSENLYEEMMAFLWKQEGARFTGNYLDNPKNPMFMPGVLSLERACAFLKDSGCQDAYLRKLRDAFANPWKTLRYPDKTEVLSYSVHPKMCFWYHPKYIGIGFTVWPNLKTKRNYAEGVASGQINISEPQQPVVADAAPIPQVPGRPLLDKGRLSAERPRFLTYETGDQMVLWQAETDVAMNKILQLLPKDPEQDPARYAHYCDVMRQMRESGLEKFCSIYTTDEGLIKTKPICEARKAIITFLAGYKCVTSKLPFLDEDMSCYGNDCIRRMTMLGQARKIINCRIAFMAGSLNSTFDKKRPGKPKFHMLLCGPPQAGKTFPLLQHIREAFIPGTHTDINSSSGKANFIDGHLGSVIVLCDEPQEYLTDAKAEAKYYDEVQDMKAALVDHKHSRTILKQIEVDGISMRIQQSLNTDDPRTWAYCTNKPRNKNSALASRIFQVTIPKPVLLPEDFNFEEVQLFAADTQKNLRLDQALCVQVYDAIICGVLPDIDMWLADNVTARVFSILRKWNVIDSSKGERVRQIIFAFVRHQIITRGVVACRHVPGGALYMVDYDAKDVYKIGPYLVCTLEIIYAALHLLIGEIIDEDAANVLRAACKECNYDPDKSPYENYKNQETPDSISFKLELNKNAEAAQEQGRFSKDKYNINLNMLAMPGKLKTIAARIERYTHPELDRDQVISVLERICGQSFPPMNGKRYQIQTQARMESMVYRGEPFVHPENPGEQLLITEESLLIPCEKLTVAEYYDDRRGLFCFCPALIPLLDVDVVDRAFNLATVSAAFPRQKAIRGLVYDENPDIFRVAIWNDAFVEAYVRQIDALHPNAPVPRREGIALSSKEKLTHTEQDILLSVTLDPQRENHEETYWRDVILARSKDFRVVKDWELEAAKRVAYRFGTPLDQIVFYTEEEIQKRYSQYCREHPEAYPVAKACYPVSILEERKPRDNVNKEITKQMVDPKGIRISSELLPEQVLLGKSFSKLRTLPPPVAASGASGSARETLRKSARVRHQDIAVPREVLSSSSSRQVHSANPAAAAAGGGILELLQRGGVVLPPPN